METDHENSGERCNDGISGKYCNRNCKDETALEKMRQQLSDMETAAYGEDRKVDLTYMMNFDMSGSVEEKNCLRKMLCGAPQ